MGVPVGGRWDAPALTLPDGPDAPLLRYADAFVAFQADYPGDWRVTVADHVRAGDRAVVRCVVTDGRETYGVATFARVGGDGRIVEVVEVWTDAVRPAGS